MIIPDPAKETVQIINATICAFVEQHASNEIILNALEEHIEVFTRLFTGAMDKLQNSEESSAVLSYLKSFKDEQRRLFDSFGTTTQGSLVQFSNDIVQRVDRQVASTISRLDINALSEALNAGVRQWLTSYGQTSTSDMRANLLELRNSVKDFIREPIEHLRAQILTEGFHRQDGTLTQLDHVVNEVHSNLCGAMERLTSQNDLMRQTPSLVKSILSETLAGLNSEITSVRTLLSDNKIDRLKEDTAITRDVISDVKTQIDSLHRQMITTKLASSSSRGQHGETILFDALGKRLRSHNGYSVEDVSSTPNGLDILITRDGYPDIRIDSKAYGRDTLENVPKREVSKFQADLVKQNCHGVLVSHYNGIACKGTIEIQQLSTGKVAVYVAPGNKPSIDDLASHVIDILGVIYTIASMIENSTDGDNKVFLSTDSLNKVRRTILSYSQKLADIRASLNNSLGQLNEIMLDSIETILIRGDDAPVVDALSCAYCHKDGFKNAQGKLSHEKHCDTNPNKSNKRKTMTHKPTTEKQ